MRVREALARDAGAWWSMRCALWPDEDADELRREVDAHFAGGVRHLLAVLVAEADDGLLGFAELNVRAHAEGCATDRVAFLEGWYVAPGHRRGGVGAALVAAASDWGRARGCTEFASDALHDNTLGLAAHRGVGFVEVEAIRCFRMSLDDAG